ncbi:Protein of unknown function [Anaplasma phagocytophilum]|uniref:Uncharacterized protein n=1 Tax=Anaplasma phagocytophilum TaxID=948 RepID=A0A098EH58_ANAPH|nr:Protein of unknown function [Anaplasma phagocytophilum]
MMTLSHQVNRREEHNLLFILPRFPSTCVWRTGNVVHQNQSYRYY